MDEADSHQDENGAKPAATSNETLEKTGAEGLRDQIAALRQQVKDAQETLRDHQRRREGRSFKR